MKKTGIITNQRVWDKKICISRDLRRNMTRAESVFWGMVKNRKLFNLKFRRQQIIDGLIVDFYCNELGLVVEIDGSIHENLDQKYIDDQRNQIFKSRNLQIIRFSNYDIFNKLDHIIEQIENILNKSK
jgi:very-short-patch-repair endonuclease